MDHLIKNTQIVNEGKIIAADILLHNGRIEKIAPNISTQNAVTEISGEGKYLLPGVIDDQVHFREPGLTHKAEIATESAAAVAGGVTTFMDMPNVNPPSLTRSLLEERYTRAAQCSPANFSFYMGVSNDNADEVLSIDPQKICGIKIFMGSSTGNMLVDDISTLEHIFRNAPTLIATHCEDEQTILHNLEIAKEKYGEDIPMHMHPIIRNEEACIRSSSFAVGLAKKHGTRLHVLHISTADELSLFDNAIPLHDKRITAEVCIHHLHFDADDYERSGSRIKWNPAVKDKHHKTKLWEALLNGTLDVIATDHAPHTLEEKTKKYMQCPSGGPLVQHSLAMMLDYHHKGKITLEQIAEKMSHHVATCFRIAERGFIREGYFADLVLVDTEKNWTVSADNILYKCGWSPLEGMDMRGAVTHTFVNGKLVFAHGKVQAENGGMRLTFDR
ncbi:MAG: dihydroorotase [Chitinophagales bacterium]